MGREKSKLRLGGRSLLAHIKGVARQLGLPLRVVRHDLLPRCGPLGGVYTALKTSKREAELFLACDMPFVSPRLLSRLLKLFQAQRRPVFVRSEKGGGFPFILPVATLPAVARQIAKGEFSLQELARALGAPLVRALHGPQELFNVNTPQDWQEARQYWKARRGLRKGERQKRTCKSDL